MIKVLLFLFFMTEYCTLSLVLTFVVPSAGCTWSKTQSSSRRDDNEAGPQGEGKAPCWIKRRVWPVSHYKLIGQSTIVFLPLIYLKEFTLSPYRGMWEGQGASLQIWRSGFGRASDISRGRGPAKYREIRQKYFQIHVGKTYLMLILAIRPVLFTPNVQL